MIKVKICGLKRLEDIDYANALKPDYIGFVFAKSKRQVTLEQAKELKRRLSKDIKAVGVFQNEEINNIKEIVDLKIIDIIQLHGSENEQYLNELRKIVNVEIIKYSHDFKDYDADYLLFDNSVPGSGVVFNWKNVKTNKPFFLAGGINLGNVLLAKELNPYAIDVSSGVEVNGLKNFDLMKEFIKQVRM